MSDLVKNVAELKKFIKDKEFSCGWMSDETLGLLSGLIKFYRPELVIHTGFLWGKSSVFIMDALSQGPIEETPWDSKDQDFYKFCQANYPNRDGYGLIVVDNNMFNLDIEDALEYIRDHVGNIKAFNSDSKSFFRLHKERLKALNLSGSIFGIVDGDHTSEGCWDDLVSMDYIGAKVIVVDDTIWLPYLADVCLRFANQYNYDFQNHRLHSGLGVLVKKE